MRHGNARIAETKNRDGRMLGKGIEKLCHISDILKVLKLYEKTPSHRAQGICGCYIPVPRDVNRCPSGTTALGCAFFWGGEVSPQRGYLGFASIRRAPLLAKDAMFSAGQRMERPTSGGCATSTQICLSDVDKSLRIWGGWSTIGAFFLMGFPASPGVMGCPLIYGFSFRKPLSEMWKSVAAWGELLPAMRDARVCRGGRRFDFRSVSRDGH